MTWVIEDMAPNADGDITTFVISHAPILASMTVFFPAMPDEQVSTNPIGAMQYAVNGTTVTFGIPPSQGRTPWCRYFYNAVPQGPAITVPLRPDSLRNYWIDQLKGVEAKRYSLTADSLNNWAELIFPYRIMAGLGPDSLNNWADQAGTNRLMVRPSDDLNNWADTVQTNRIRIIMSDSLAGYSDSITIIKT